MNIEERNEIERMENEGGKSAWWNDTERNQPFANPTRPVVADALAMQQVQSAAKRRLFRLKLRAELEERAQQKDDDRKLGEAVRLAHPRKNMADLMAEYEAERTPAALADQSIRSVRSASYSAIKSAMSAALADQSMRMLAEHKARKVNEAFSPYLAYSYAGHGWVTVVSQARGQPPRRLVRCADGSGTVVADALLQGEAPTGD